MEYRRLGRSGLKVSNLSFGSWVTFSFQLDVSAATEIMKVAYDAGEDGDGATADELEQLRALGYVE